MVISDHQLLHFSLRSLKQLNGKSSKKITLHSSSMRSELCLRDDDVRIVFRFTLNCRLIDSQLQRHLPFLFLTMPNKMNISLNVDALNLVSPWLFIIYTCPSLLGFSSRVVLNICLFHLQLGKINVDSWEFSRSHYLCEIITV